MNLIDKVFKPERWQEAIDKGNKKHISKEHLLEMCDPKARNELYRLIKEGKYDIFPPRVQKIPKDKKDEFREVYINQPRDRLLLSIINDVLCEEFADMIHPQCTSYQKGMSTQQTVEEVSKQIVKMAPKEAKQIGWKSDFSKYFDTVKIEVIDGVFDEWERRTGAGYGTDPIINLLRKYYHQDIYFDTEGKIQHKYQSLKQGCSVASILANVCLYDLDDFMSKKYKIYCRYSDDIVVIDEDYETVVEDINNFIKRYGMTLNPKKVEPLYSDKWFKFLGFNIKGSQITLSANRVKKFRKMVDELTINKKKCSSEQAKRNLIRYLFDGDHSWASSCLGVINVEEDMLEMSKYMLDCIRACDTKKKKIGGLGVDLQKKNGTIARGKGRDVKSNRLKTSVSIDSFASIGCLAKAYKLNKSVYEAVVRGL